MPIFQSTMYEVEPGTGYHDTRYIRLNNTPNHLALHQKMASLENAEDALVTASGMAAISSALMTILSAGDHLLAQECLYGGTHNLITQDLPAWGIQFDFIDANDPDQWQRLVRPNTKAIYMETMTNPLLEVADHEAVIRFARDRGIVSMVDNTIPCPVNFRPPEWGYDLSLHSGTKYLNGHSDLVAGALIGRADLVRKIRHRVNHLGGCLDPHTAFLLHRGIKTVGVRVRHQNASALRIARFLQDHPAVSKINFPGLESHPQHARAQRLFEGYAGLLSLELVGGLEAAKRLIEKLRIPIEAPSLGGVETLVTRPSTTSHAGMAPEDRKRLGITDSLVRVSVGIEDTEDLLEDIGQALESL